MPILYIFLSIYRSNNTKIISIDQDFPGLSELINLKQEKTIKLVFVHGIGEHCIGYSEPLLQGISKKINLKSKFNYEKALQDLKKKIPQEIRQLEEIKRDKLTLEEKHRKGLIPGIVGSDCKFIYKDKESLEEYPQPIEQSLKNVCTKINNYAKFYQMNCQRIEIEYYFDNPEEPERKIAKAILGYIRTQSFFREDDKGFSKPILQAYELVWSPATSWAKNWYTSHDLIFDKSRDFFNKSLKAKIINDSISDALIYLGDYRPVVQFPVLMAYCKVIVNEQKAKEVFNCPLFENQTDVLTNVEEEEIAILSHSLGTRIVFDTLGLLGKENFVEEYSSSLRDASIIQNHVPKLKGQNSKAVDNLVSRFSKNLSQITAFANQVPILELSELDHPNDFGSNESSARDLGTNFNKFLNKRESNTKRPLTIVAFSDPNDVLTYNLKCWYYHHILRWTTETRNLMNTYLEKTETVKVGNKNVFYKNMFGNFCKPENPKWEDTYKKLWDLEKSVSISDVSVNLSGIKLHGLYTDVLNAHSYFKRGNNTVPNLIVCGGSAEGVKAKDCTSTF